MKVVIDIDDDLYTRLFDNGQTDAFDMLKACSAIRKGTPIPKGHGDLIDRNLALSDDGLREFHMYNDYVKMRNYLKSISPIIEADKVERSDDRIYADSYPPCRYRADIPDFYRK